MHTKQTYFQEFAPWIHGEVTQNGVVSVESTKPTSRWKDGAGHYRCTPQQDQILQELKPILSPMLEDIFGFVDKAKLTFKEKKDNSKNSILP